MLWLRSLQGEVSAGLRLISDNAFLKHLKNKKEAVWLLILLALAVALIIFGSVGASDEGVDDSYESRVADICNSIEGVGKCRVLIYYGEPATRYSEKKVEGIVVVCEGAGSVDVRRRLTDALSSFFGIGSNRVIIERMQK